MNWFECPKCGEEIPAELAQKGRCKRCGDVVVRVGGLADTLNLNTATKLELERIGGLGPIKAVRIVNYRKEHPFTDVSDLLKVRNIGKTTYDKIKDKVYLK